MNEDKRDDDTLNGSDDAYSYDLFDVAAQNEHSAEQSSVQAEPIGIDRDTADDEQENGENQAAEKTISADLIRGHINTIILRALYDGDKYGYEIIADIEQKSRGQYSLKQPSLYSALKRLEREGYVTSYWGGSAGGGRRKYFSLTDNGKEIAERNQSEWEYSRTVIDSLISDREFDFENNPAPLAVDMRVLRNSTSRVPRYDGESAEEYDETDFEPEAEEDMGTANNADALNEEFEQQRAAFEAERSRVEEELRLREEELRTREELFRAEEEQRNRALTEQAEQQRLEEEKRLEEERQRVEAERAAAEAEARRQEEERLRQVQEARIAEEQALKAAEEERNRIREEIAERTRQEEERANVAALRAEKEQQNARIVEMEPFTEERERYEQMLKQQEAEFKALHEKELAEQERRIREEDERLFRQREQQMIHQNYLNLVNTPVQEEPEENAFYNIAVEEPKTNETPVNPEAERGYRSVIQKLYSNTIKQEEQHAAPEETVKKPVSHTPAPAPVTATQEVRPTPAPIPAPAPVLTPAPVPKKNVAATARPVEPPKEKTAPKPLSGIDFYDLEMRAAQDGIRITTSGGGTREISETVSYNLVHKGKALFFSALVVFLLCIAEGSIALGFQNALKLPRFYPYFIWGTGLALLLITGLAYVNHYGERALRTSGNLLINVIVTYALCIIIILIVSLAVQIDFTSVGQLTTYIIFPIVYFFGIVVFGLVYYMQVRPLKED